MDFFQTRPGKILEFAEKFAGFWPYQSKHINYPIRFLLYFFLVSSTITSIAAIINREGVDPLLIIETGLSMMLKTGVLTKLIMACLFQAYRKACYEKIIQHFREMTDENESNVLLDCAESGIRFAVIYLAAASILGSVYLTLPIDVVYFDYMFNPNTTELEKKLPIHVDYLVDHNEYYNLIILHILCYMTSVFLTLVPYDTAYILEVRHIIALFKIIMMRLKKGSEMFDSYENSKKSIPKTIEDKARLIISEAIMLHNEAFEMINLIEDTNNVGMAGILFQNMILLGACPFLLSVHLGRPVEFIRYVLIFVLISLHFWVIFTHGQMIIDYSSAILDAWWDKDHSFTGHKQNFLCSYHFKWYYSSKKSSILIHIMMTRSVIQSEMTGGKLFILSMETYGKMVKTGLSLFTIFKSLGIA